MNIVQCVSFYVDIQEITFYVEIFKLRKKIFFSPSTI